MIEQDEVKRLLAALLQENPAIDLNDEEIDGIVDQVTDLLPSASSTNDDGQVKATLYWMLFRFYFLMIF